MTTKTRESSDLNDAIEPAFKLQNSVEDFNFNIISPFQKLIRDKNISYENYQKWLSC